MDVAPPNADLGISAYRPLISGRDYIAVPCHYGATQTVFRVLDAGGNAVDAGGNRVEELRPWH